MSYSFTSAATAALGTELPLHLPWPLTHPPCGLTTQPPHEAGRRSTCPGRAQSVYTLPIAASPLLPYQVERDIYIYVYVCACFLLKQYQKEKTTPTSPMYPAIPTLTSVSSTPARPFYSTASTTGRNLCSSSATVLGSCAVNHRNLQPASALGSPCRPLA